MTDRDNNNSPVPPEVLDFYTHVSEESRLETGASQLEFERTRELLLRFLPSAPSKIVDVGGAAGAYAFWLAERGHEVHLIDATPRLVEETKRRNAVSKIHLASIAVGNACGVVVGRWVSGYRSTVRSVVITCLNGRAVWWHFVKRIEFCVKKAG